MYRIIMCSRYNLVYINNNPRVDILNNAIEMVYRSLQVGNRYYFMIYSSKNRVPINIKNH